MKFFRHILPLMGISLATLLIFQIFYVKITNYEESRCWQELQTTVDDVGKEMRLKFRDEISKLHLLETLIESGGVTSADELHSLYLDKVQSDTMFTRIDVLYADSTLVSNGQKIELDQPIDFEKISRKDEYLTERKIDFMNGKPCVYYVLPIKENDAVSAVLIGVIDCEDLYMLFRPTLYNGDANLCIIDADDGNYIMDTWHEGLGNLYDLNDRELLSEYEDVDFRADIAGLKEGTIAFVSQTTGHDLYMYYAPLGIFDWEIAVFTTDNVIFAGLMNMRKSFIIAGVIEILLLLLYCGWNIYLIRKLQNTNKEIQNNQTKLEFLSYHDVLTGLYNRHKYFETLSRYMQHKPAAIGVLYADLNGLKTINDTASHEEGDEYICTAAGLLIRVFGDCCYRIGGDEFVVMLSDIDRKGFEEKVAYLNRAAAEQHISLSIGTLWEAQCDDINDMLVRAEKAMYAAKKTYYQSKTTVES